MYRNIIVIAVVAGIALVTTSNASYATKLHAIQQFFEDIAKKATEEATKNADQQNQTIEDKESLRKAHEKLDQANGTGTGELTPPSDADIVSKPGTGDPPPPPDVNTVPKPAAAGDVSLAPQATSRLPVAGDYAILNFSGLWDTKTAGQSLRMSLEQDNGVVTGTYTGKVNGTITGKIDVHGRLIFAWTETDGAHGTGIFVVAPGGDIITGHYSDNDDPNNVTSIWNGKRTK